MKGDIATTQGHVKTLELDFRVGNGRGALYREHNKRVTKN